MAVTTLQDLKDYIFRKLGSPVINIEVSNEQIEDRIEESLQMFYEDHYDGVDVGYLIIDLVDGQTEYQLDSTIQSVVEIISDNGNLDSSDENLLFSGFYSYNNNTFEEYSLVSLAAWRQRVAAYEGMFLNIPMFDYNSTSHKLFLYETPTSATKIAVRVYRSASDLTNIYNNLWLKKYCTALVRLQWGNNVGKFGNVILPGGGSYNYSDIIGQAQEEIEKLELELFDKYSEPIGFFIG